MTNNTFSIGIDLGTSSSVIAYFDGKSSKIIPNVFNENALPSRVILTPDGRYSVGREAANHAERFESQNFTVGSIKRQMHEGQGFVIQGKRYYPQVISAMVLSALKKQAEEFLKVKIEEVVICIPCNFGVIQRYATIEAAEMAGFKVLRLVNESTAAAVAFNYLSKGHSEDRELIFDLGAGTLDLSLIDYIGNGTIEVKSIEGEEFLGGDDFDERIVQHIVNETKRIQGFDPIEDQNRQWHHIAKLRLKEAAEKAKMELSFQNSTKIYIPYIRNILGNYQHIDMELTSSVFEAICGDLLDRILVQTDKLALKTSEENEITAQSNTISPLREKLLFWKRKKQEVVKGVKRKIVPKFVFTGGASKMPLVRDNIERRYGDAFSFVNRDKELVAMGAAIYAAIIKGYCKNWLLLDCTSKSIGIGLKDEKYQIVIPKSFCIPTRKKDKFVTTVDNQKHINITVYEGENIEANKNRKLIDLEFGPLASAKAGEGKIDVTFEVDVNSMLRIEAVDLTVNTKLPLVQTLSPYTYLDPKIKNTIKELLKKG